MSDRLKLGTRGSKLALAQARLIAKALGGAEIVAVRSGDGEPGDKERFVRGVGRAVVDGEADLAVHSAKDLPGNRPDELRLVGVHRLPEGARVGTASLRRRSQLLALRPDLELVELHGNVDTRLRKLSEGEFDGIVLAAAGLRRLALESKIAFGFGLDELTPAAGQGSLALEARSDDPNAAAAAASISDHDALVELTAERTAVATLRATCHTPVGICARLEGGELAVHGFAGLPDGSEWVRDRVTGDAEQPAALGQAIAERLLAAGAGPILERAEALA